MLDLTVGPALFYIYALSYDLAVGVMVCKASVLDGLGGPSAFYIYALS